MQSESVSGFWSWKPLLHCGRRMTKKKGVLNVGNNGYGFKKLIGLLDLISSLTSQGQTPPPRH